MAALGILEFTWIWNDFIWGMVLIQRDAIKPVTVGIQNLQAAYIQSWGDGKCRSFNCNYSHRSGVPVFEKIFY